MKDEIINSIKKSYQKKRLRSMEDLKIRKEEIYDMIPRMKEIDKDIAKLSLDVSRIIINKSEDYEKDIANIKETITLLREEKAYIMHQRKIPEIYFKEVHVCSKCNDTGYEDNGKMCSCFKQSLINELYNISGLGELLEKENFSTFDLMKFDDVKYANEKLTPRENMKIIKKQSFNFIENFPNSDRNLLFYGGTGMGKTFICNCIAKELIDRGILVLYQTSFKMFEIISEHKFNRNMESFENKDNFSMIYDSDLLILDDLGTESINSFTTTELFNIINTRMITNKKTIISTNLSLEKLSETYSDRIISRIVSKYDIFKFYGKDLRIKRG
jgi:DNA replication protein DnaC